VKPRRTKSIASRAGAKGSASKDRTTKQPRIIKKPKRKTQVRSSSAPTGRKDKRYSPEVIAALEKALNTGLSNAEACAVACIGETTFYRWMLEGENAQEGTLKREFWKRIKKATTDVIGRNVAQIQKAGNQSWQACAWWLERRYPDTWGRRERMEMTGAAGGPIQTVTQTCDVPLAALDLSIETRKEILEAIRNKKGNEKKTAGS